MCAIAGIIHLDGTGPPETERVRAMLAAMGARGPDAAAVAALPGVTLGNARLSILDVAGGRQPMAERHSGAHITFNGAVVNFVELRSALEDEGETFSTSGDTEVLLRLLVRRGEGALPLLDGMFAFAFHDPRQRTTLLARDPMGVKPLLLAEDRRALLFASDARGLLAGLPGRPAADEEAVLDYLSFQLPLGTRTLFRGIRRLAPGSLLRVRHGRVEERTWWSPPEGTAEGPRGEEATEALREAVLRSTVRCLRSDAAVGTTLSGGLDSTLVTAAAARAAVVPLPAYHGSYDQGPAFDEGPHARSAAAALGVPLREVPMATASAAADLPAAMASLDEPMAGPAVLGTWCVARAAAGDGVRVLLGGHGADELFSGYARHLAVEFAAALHRSVAGDARPLLALLPGLGPLRGYEALVGSMFADGEGAPDGVDAFFRTVHRGAGLDRVLTEETAARRRATDPRARFRSAFPGEDAGDLRTRVTLFETRVLLPALLHVEDRATMAHGLEARVPLLGKDVLALAFSLPPEERWRGGGLKALLREAARGLVPEPVRLREDKMGFPVPLAPWARGPLRPWISDLLLGDTARRRGLWRTEAVEDLLSRPGVAARELWALISLETWYRQMESGR